MQIFGRREGMAGCLLNTRLTNLALLSFHALLDFRSVLQSRGVVTTLKPVRAEQARRPEPITWVYGRNLQLGPGAEPLLGV